MNIKNLCFSGFLIVQEPKLRMLELCYNFIDKFYDINSFKKSEMDADFVLLEKNWTRVFDLKRKQKER